MQPSFVCCWLAKAFGPDRMICSSPLMELPNKKTKIVATVGPSSDTPETLSHLMSSGVNVFRFNMKHGTVAWHEKRIKLAREIAKKLGSPIGILIDLQGPEIRIETTNQEELVVKKGDLVYFTHQSFSNFPSVWIPVVAYNALGLGDFFSIDDGFISLKVTKKQNKFIAAKVLSDGVIKHRKGLNIPGKELPIPSLVDSDFDKLDMATRVEVGYVALSFSRTRKDVETLRKELKKRSINAQVVAKIENQQSIEHIDELIDAADCIMVARGDLGVEIPFEEIAFWQKTIINKCRFAHKPVIVATQMLQSMVESPLPTRAEVTDVANAVFDGTDAVMLSGETASGEYPLEAARAMSRILSFNEQKKSSGGVIPPSKNTTELVASAAVRMVESQYAPNIDAIVVFTETGYTARVLASFRPKTPIFAVSDSKETAESLALSYGVVGVVSDFPSGVFQLPNPVLNDLKKRKLIKRGQTILVIHGQHWKVKGLTSALALWTVE